MNNSNNTPSNNTDPLGGLIGQVYQQAQRLISPNGVPGQQSRTPLPAVQQVNRQVTSWGSKVGHVLRGLDVPTDSANY